MSDVTQEQLEKLARKHGLPPNLIKRVRGDSLDEIEADIKELADEASAARGESSSRPRPPSQQPRERLDAGVPVDDAPSPREVAEQVVPSGGPVGSVDEYLDSLGSSR